MKNEERSGANGQESLSRGGIATAPADVAGSHTPGPWRIERTGTLFDVEAADGGICRPCHGRGRETDAANARLIAAAPDLLAALKGMLDQPETTEAYDASLQRAIDAIAKAEGR